MNINEKHKQRKASSLYQDRVDPRVDDELQHSNNKVTCCKSLKDPRHSVVCQVCNCNREKEQSTPPLTETLLKRNVVQIKAQHRRITQNLFS